MERLVRFYEGNKIRITVMDDGECLFAIYDVAAALELEFARKKVMDLVFSKDYKYHRKALVDWYGQQEYVVSTWFVFGLALQAEQTKAQRMINWVHNQVKTETAKFAANNQYFSSEHTRDYYTVTQIAKMYSMSAQTLNEFLARKSIQYKVNGSWVLYAAYVDKGFGITKEIEKPNGEKVLHLYWTAKGLQLIKDLLESVGVVPHKQLELNV